MLIKYKEKSYLQRVKVKGGGGGVIFFFFYIFYEIKNN